MDAYYIEGIQRNDEKAFSQLYEQYHSKLYYYFLNKTQSADISADLVQTTFIKCWRYRQHLVIDKPLSHQLFRIAKTTLIDLLRQKARERLIHLDASFISGEIPERAPGQSPRLEEVSATLIHISPERRKIIEFRLEGLTNTEIAERLHISKKTVENQVNRAIKEIRSHMSSSIELGFPAFLLFLLYKEEISCTLRNLC